jgi:hypothetical protein
MPSFANCSLETRTAVFYDLLANLLLGNPEEQAALIRSSQFQALPPEEQARIVRLMASKTLLYEPQVEQVSDWLRRSRALNPADRRATLLSKIYAVSPVLCRALLKLRTLRQCDERRRPPFADLNFNSGAV